MLRTNDRLVKIVIALIALSTPASAQHGGHRMGGMADRPVMRHDSTARAQMGVIHELLAKHGAISRSVTQLHNGVRTVTESTDSLVARRIQEHVVTMYARLASGQNPGWPMQSDALDLLYKNSALITTQIDSTANGIIVTQTSADSATVVALRTHATEVTALVKGGMDAMHAAMMQRHGGMMPHGAHGQEHADSSRGHPGRAPHTHRPPGSR